MNKEMTEFSHYFLVNIKFASLLLRINRVLFLFGIGEEDALLLTFFVHPQTEMSCAPPPRSPVVSQTRDKQRRNKP